MMVAQGSSVNVRTWNHSVSKRRAEHEGKEGRGWARPAACCEDPTEAVSFVRDASADTRPQTVCENLRARYPATQLGIPSVPRLVLSRILRVASLGHTEALGAWHPCTQLGSASVPGVPRLVRAGAVRACGWTTEAARRPFHPGPP
eukprot:3058934-Rhodomonas_salina.1